MMEKNVTFVTFEAVFCQKSRKARIAADLSLLGGIRDEVNVRRRVVKVLWL